MKQRVVPQDRNACLNGHVGTGTQAEGAQWAPVTDD